VSLRPVTARRLLLAALTACATVAPAAIAAGQPLPSTPVPSLPLLHSVRGSDPRIADAGGRQVLLRGVDVDALGDYYQQYAQYPAVEPLRANDYREMAGLGFNVVRLVLSWSSLEPTPGAFNLAYVAEIRRAVGWAATNGIYTVLDMHQDAWGIGAAGPPGGRCPPGFSEAVGFDGAPQWATITDGLTPCALGGVRELSPADEAAWQNFYDNDKAIQTQLIDTWARLAGAFAADPAVAGYDLLNEPNPGLTLGEATGALGGYYSQALSAIRAAESAAPGGLHHIAFFEPGVEWSLLGTTLAPQGAFTADPDVVFAPHLYSGSLAVSSVDQGFTFAQSAARSYGTTVWSGEYGWYGDPAQNETDIAEFARQQDAHLWGGAWWQWQQACGSPSSIGSYGGAPPTVTNSLVRITCAPGPIDPGPLPSTSALAIPASTERIVARATVHAAPGVIGSLKSDPATGAFAVSGTAPLAGGDCELQAWIPGSGQPHFTSAGVTAPSAIRVRGGYAVTGCARGPYTLSLSGRSAPGLSCAAALRVSGGIVLRGGRRLKLRLRERAAAESPCAGTVLLRGGGSARFDISPGTGRWVILRTRRRLAHPRVVVMLSGEDVDANAFALRRSLRALDGTR
jgi:endoglycosylceramidase